MSTEHIQKSISDVREYLTAHPGEARSPDKAATAVVEEGLRCRATGPGGASLVTDMSTAIGGGGTAPSPGWMMRAALATCDATLITMCAAEEGVTLKTLEVTVDSESDDRGLMGMGESIPAGPLSLRMRIRIAADGVSPERLREVVERALARSPVADAICRAVPSKHEIEIG